MKLRCGKCEACKIVEATQRIVFAECRPAGPGVNDATVEMWNRVLKDNPCERTPSLDKEVNIKCRTWVLHRETTMEHLQRFVEIEAENGWILDHITCAANIRITFAKGEPMTDEPQ